MAWGWNIGDADAVQAGTSSEDSSLSWRPGACSVASPAAHRRATRSTETVRGHCRGLDAGQKAVGSAPYAGAMQCKNEFGTAVGEAGRRMIGMPGVAMTDFWTWRAPM